LTAQAAAPILPPRFDVLKGMRAIVRGRVQGVGFRIFVLNEAQQLGLCGFVRNLSDGTVEVVATGTLLDLNKLMARLEQGPRGAIVTQVEQSALDPLLAFETFEVRG
jgi:acylphosphatase